MKLLPFIAFAVLCAGANTASAQTDCLRDLRSLPTFKSLDNGVKLSPKSSLVLDNLEQAAKMKQTTKMKLLSGGEIVLHYGPYNSLPIYPNVVVGGGKIVSPLPNWEKRDFNGQEYYFIPLPTNRRGA